MKHGESVSAFEREFATFTGARFCIAASNGTVTLQAALHALGVQPGNRVATTPLTMAATSIAILNVGAVPVLVDVDERTWLMSAIAYATLPEVRAHLPVDLFGLSAPMDRGAFVPFGGAPGPMHHNSAAAAGFDDPLVVDAAQTLRCDIPVGNALVSYSFQHSKILSLGEGGALVTNDEELAARARSYLSLGYRMSATQARIDPDALKSPTFERHHLRHSINGRMNDITASLGLGRLQHANQLLADRRDAAAEYRTAIADCPWLAPQFVPTGWKHSWWTFAIACDTPERAVRLSDAVVKHGGERPYPAWQLTFAEPAFAYLDPGPDACPVARSLQPRLLQFQTNDLASAERNAKALRAAIQELDP